jgi:hypothetical protein
MENFNESTLKQLYNSAVKAFPQTTKRQHATNPIKIIHLEWTPFKGMKTLFVKGTAQNEDREYNTLVLFKKVNYLSEQTSDSIKLIDNIGLTYTLEKLSPIVNEVMVRCSCPDFKWRFKHWNYLDRSLYGVNGKKYEGKGGPPANPSELPGMCKHLIKTMIVLERSGIFG